MNSLWDEPVMMMMPDGSQRPVPKCFSRPQSEWTGPEIIEVAALQAETLEMQKRLAGRRSAES